MKTTIATDLNTEYNCKATTKCIYLKDPPAIAAVTGITLRIDKTKLPIEQKKAYLLRRLYYGRNSVFLILNSAVDLGFCKCIRNFVYIFHIICITAYLQTFCICKIRGLLITQRTIRYSLSLTLLIRSGVEYKYVDTTIWDSSCSLFPAKNGNLLFHMQNPRSVYWPTLKPLYTFPHLDDVPLFYISIDY